MSLQIKNSPSDSCYYSKSSEMMDLRPNFIRDIKILPLHNLTHNNSKKAKVSHNDSSLVTQSAPPYKLNSSVLEKSDDPLT